MNNYIREDSQIKYVVKVNGAPISPPTTRELAESQKMQLPLETRHLAEVVAVTNDGKEVLFG